MTIARTRARGPFGAIGSSRCVRVATIDTLIATHKLRTVCTQQVVVFLPECSAIKLLKSHQLAFSVDPVDVPSFARDLETTRLRFHVHYFLQLAVLEDALD